MTNSVDELCVDATHLVFIVRVFREVAVGALEVSKLEDLIKIRRQTIFTESGAHLQQKTKFPLVVEQKVHFTG